MLLSKDSLSMSELRENTLVTKQAITSLVNQMENSGYIKTVLILEFVVSLVFICQLMDFPYKIRYDSI